MTDEKSPQRNTLKIPEKYVWPFMLWLSLCLHIGVLIFAFLSPERDVHFDIEWLQSLENMERIGHGDFRQIEVVESAEVVEVAEPEVAEPEVVEPEVVEVAEPEVAEPEVAEPEVAESELEPEAQVQPEVQPVELAKATKPKSKSESKPKRKDANPFDAEVLPGTNIEGPSKLPDLKGYGPGNAVFTALLRTDRLRNTRYERVVRKILELVPDYRIVLENTNIDPVSDLDSMFMASSRPQEIQHTFLAVRHRLKNDDLQQRLARRFETTLEWRDHKGLPVRDLIPQNSVYHDPRKILLHPGLAVMTRPEWLAELTNPLAADSQLRAGSKAEVSLLDGLFQIEKAAPNDTLLLVSAAGARLPVPGLGAVIVQNARIAVTNPASPLLTIDVQFDTDATAARVATACPDIRAQVVSQLPFLARGTATRFLSKLDCVAEGAYVTVKGHYTEVELEQLLGYVILAVPQPAVIARLPKPPPSSPPETVPGIENPSLDAILETVPGIEKDTLFPDVTQPDMSSAD